MTEYTPPIKERTTEELIGIANSSTDHWQPEAINQAKRELVRRNISQKEQDEVIADWVLEGEELYLLELLRLENNRTESYKIWEMLVLFIFGPILFLRPYLFNSHTLFTLRGEQYFLKFKQRLVIFGLSFMAWFFYINYSFQQSENKRLEEIQKIDISDWKELHGYE